jgi:hypothetical protein
MMRWLYAALIIHCVDCSVAEALWHWTVITMLQIRIRTSRTGSDPWRQYKVGHIHYFFGVKKIIHRNTHIFIFSTLIFYDILPIFGLGQIRFRKRNISVKIFFTFSTSCLNSENEMPCTEVQHAYTLSLNVTKTLKLQCHEITSAHSTMSQEGRPSRDVLYTEVQHAWPHFL